MNKTTYIIETSNTFDAAGTKLRKVAYDNSGVLISRTEYIGGIQYESLQPLASPPLATDLKFMSTGEGRVVKVGSNWNYEYFHKDHLGNTRVVYGYQKQVDEYKATMETQFATKEQAQFYNIATRRATVFNHTLANINVTAPDKSAETNGNTSKAIGPAKMLQVSAGDRVQLEVFAMYATGTGSNTTLISNLASAVTGSFLLNAGEAAHTVLTNSVPTQAATIGQTSGVPKAYLFYILLNSSYVYQQFGYVQVSSAALVGNQQLYLDVTIPTGGYLYTYVANESNVSAGTSVYFDDFTIVHTRNTPTLQVLQTSDYYPFGLQIAAGSYQKQTALDNDYLYNGKELQDEHNLGWLDYGARMYMPEIGRWGAVDPMSEEYFSWSNYNYVVNNPIVFIDPDGRKVDVSDLLKSKEGFYTLVNLLQGLSSSTGNNIGYKDGMLVNNGKSKSTTGSKSASDYLNSLISSEGTIHVGSNNNQDSEANGGTGRNTINLNSNDIDNGISSTEKAGLGRETFGYGMVFFHEALHTGTGTFEYRKLDGKPDNGNIDHIVTPTDPRGELVDIVNKFRTENGWATRERYNESKVYDGLTGKLLLRTLDFKDKNGTIVSVHLVQMSRLERSSRQFESNKQFVNHLINQNKK